MAHEEELKIEFKEDEAIINDSTVIKSKPLATFLKHALWFLLGPRDGEVTITRDYYDEHVASYVISQDSEESSIYISDTGVEVDGTEVKSELLASLLKHALNAFFISDGERTVEIWKRGRKYIIKATTPGG